MARLQATDFVFVKRNEVVSRPAFIDAFRPTVLVVLSRAPLGAVFRVQLARPRELLTTPRTFYGCGSGSAR